MIVRKVAMVLAVLTVWLAVGPFPANAQSGVLDAYLEAQIARHRVPGLALAIAYADGRVDVRTYGKDIAPATRFRIGSLSKTMTAIGVLRLVEDGLIDLDAPVQTYLPDFTTRDGDRARRITVRHLLNQTSGLSDRGYNHRYDPRAPDTLIPSFASARQEAEPGTRYAYFNGNYVLLGRIVEVVSGQSYPTYMNENVFAPAGMDHALADDSPMPAAAEGLAQGHILLYGFPIPYAEHLPIPAPSGGIIASGADMAAFLRQFVIHDPAILTRAGIREMLTVPSAIDTPYAMGWFGSESEDEARIFTHSGDLMTFHADMALLPDDGVAFALLYNRQNLLSSFTTYPEIRNGVADILRGGEASGGGLNARGIGIIILVISLIAVAGDARRLLMSRQWTARAHEQSIGRRGMSLALLPISLYVILLLPSLMPVLTGQAITYTVLIAYLPDIMLLLTVTAVLSVLTLIVRLIFWRQSLSTHTPT